MTKLLVFALALALCGCSAATGKMYSDTDLPKNKTEVIVFRPHIFWASGGNISVGSDSTVMCKMPDRSFVVFFPKTDKTVLTASAWSAPGTSEIQFNSSQRNQYYFEIVPDPSKEAAGFFAGLAGMLAANSVSKNKGPFEIREVPEDVAKKELAHMKRALECN